MLAAVVVPHPPALVPALSTGAAAELAPLLDACDQAVAGLIAQAPEVVVCVGAGDRTIRRRSRDWGTLAGFGVAVEAPVRHGDGRPQLPLSLTIGRWLLERVGWDGAVVLQEVATDAAEPDCRDLARELADECGPRAGWLVLGDGSNRRGPRSPGYDHPLAEPFDAEVAAAFGRADLAAIEGLDAGRAAELGAAGRAPWQVLAGAVSSSPSSVETIETVIRYQGAPLGVGYLVAEWRFDR